MHKKSFMCHLSKDKTFDHSNWLENEHESCVIH
jgi:hypothetical protein